MWRPSGLGVPSISSAVDPPCWVDPQAVAANVRGQEELTFCSSLAIGGASAERAIGAGSLSGHSTWQSQKLSYASLSTSR
jgi:hypothetical protein